MLEMVDVYVGDGTLFMDDGMKSTKRHVLESSRHENASNAIDNKTMRHFSAFRLDTKKRGNSPLKRSLSLCTRSYLDNTHSYLARF